MTILALLALLALLSVIAAKDLATMTIPDEANFALAVSGLAFSSVLPVSDLVSAILGACFGGLCSWALRRLYYRMRGYHGLGLGDVKLIAAAGCWTGPDGMPPMLFIAALAGLLVCGVLYACGTQIGRRDRIPFGPFLCLGLACIASIEILTHQSLVSLLLGSEN